MYCKNEEINVIDNKGLKWKGCDFMGIYVNPRNNGFKEAVQSEIYVDKTELIHYTNKLINTEQKYVCISRPRRFGKTMAAKMLIAYYSKGCHSEELFEPYKITKDANYKKHLNQYNVIALNIKKLLTKVNTIEELLQSLQRKVIKEIKNNYFDVEFENETILSDVLENVYDETEEKFIFIIDEWDCVLREKQYMAKDHEIYLNFMQGLLKDQDYVSLAYMTGILPIKKYGTHSALNMFAEYSMIDPGQFAPYVGFTEEEVKKLCDTWQMNFDMMKNWYDGYVFNNDLHVYSPKSVVDSISRNKFSSYWTQTETYEALKKYIVLDYDGLKDAIMQMMAENRVNIDCETFQNDMTTFKSKDDVLTLLVHLGYLAYDGENGQVFIPNSEIRSEFERAVKKSDWQEMD